MSELFDYQKKVWGTAIPTTSPFSLAGLRFYYFLKNINGTYGKLLEVGCGAGGNLQALKKYRPYLDLYGTDISVPAITLGLKLFPRVHLSVAPAESLPFETESMDIVCFFDVLEHVENPLVCIKEAYRVLKQGGVMHAYIPCEGELFTIHGLLNKIGINFKEKTAGHIQKLTKKEVVHICIESGFSVTETRWSCHLLNQIGDISYYLFLTVTGKKLEQSLEGSLQVRRSPVTVLALLLKSIVSWVWYWESRILWWFPGAGLHITCRK